MAHRDEEEREFRGLDRRQDFLRTLEQVEGGTISPGGAAQLLGISRQRVWVLVHEGKLRQWSYYNGRSPVASMVEISVRDLIEYGVRWGRIRSVEDCGLQGELIRSEVARAMGVDRASTALVD